MLSHGKTMTKLREAKGTAVIDQAAVTSPHKFTVTLHWTQAGHVRRHTIAFGLKSKTDTGNDFPHHRDPARKKAYILRHEAREHWKDPQTRGFWSRWFLWSATKLPEILQTLRKHLGPNWTVHVSRAAAHQLTSPYVQRGGSAATS